MVELPVLQARSLIRAIADRQPTPQPQQHGIRAVSATYTTAHGNTRSLTHWVRPWVKPATSWFLVGFVNHCATTGTPTFLFYVVTYQFIYLFIFFFPTVQQGGQVILTCIHCNYSFSPTLSSVATWVSRHSSQCYSAGSPCKSILSCVW